MSVEISPANLQRFRAWITDRGRSEDTADLYITNLRACARDKKGLTHRLTGGDLSPNTRRTNMAALSAWARFTKDSDLRDQLLDMRLPPARRVRTKQPLGHEDWRRVVKHLQTAPVKPEAMRHVLTLIAVRGFRCGDVLRMRRSEVQRAVATGKLAYEGKGRKRLEVAAVPIKAPLAALAEMPRWERVSDLLGPGSKKVIHKRVWRASKRIAKAAGVPEMNPHRYRHTFATNFLAELHGDPNAIVKLQKFMGWESMQTAARYVDQVSQDELDTIGAGLVSGVLEDP